MKTVYDIQQLLKKFGAILYIGDRVADLELMESEINELYRAKLIGRKQYESAIFILRHQIRMEKERLGTETGSRRPD
ncbi:YqgQ family protein [Bacillaceae bacterium Marseille-Q3522]|nr:YqgQ family protein [Bacillaceae bacterium Marseille-Q3522]